MSTSSRKSRTHNWQTQAKAQTEAQAVALDPDGIARRHERNKLATRRERKMDIAHRMHWVPTRARIRHGVPCPQHPEHLLVAALDEQGQPLRWLCPREFMVLLCRRKLRERRFHMLAARAEEICALVFRQGGEDGQAD